MHLRKKMLTLATAVLSTVKQADIITFYRYQISEDIFESELSINGMHCALHEKLNCFRTVS